MTAVSGSVTVGHRHRDHGRQGRRRRRERHGAGAGPDPARVGDAGPRHARARRRRGPGGAVRCVPWPRWPRGAPTWRRCAWRAWSPRWRRWTGGASRVAPACSTGTTRTTVPPARAGDRTRRDGNARRRGVRVVGRRARAPRPAATGRRRPSPTSPSAASRPSTPAPPCASARCAWGRTGTRPHWPRSGVAERQLPVVVPMGQQAGTVRRHRRRGCGPGGRDRRRVVRPDRVGRRLGRRRPRHLRGHADRVGRRRRLARGAGAVDLAAHHRRQGARRRPEQRRCALRRLGACAARGPRPPPPRSRRRPVRRRSRPSRPGRATPGGCRYGRRTCAASGRRSTTRSFGPGSTTSTSPTTPAQLERAAYEASGFVVRHMLELAGIKARRIVASGGGTKVLPWMQAVADATGLPVDTVGVSEGAALGAAFMARMAAGLEPSFDGARAVGVCGSAGRTRRGAGRRRPPSATPASGTTVLPPERGRRGGWGARGTSLPCWERGGGAVSPKSEQSDAADGP